MMDERGTRETGRARRWLRLGLGVKRWLLVLALGSAVAGIGLVYGIIWLRLEGVVPEWLYRTVTLAGWPEWLRIVAPAGIGGAIVAYAIFRLGSTLTDPFRGERPLAEEIYQHRQMEHTRHGPRIVAIGGGTGLPSLLRGLTPYTRNLTAIVTVADDGGSSGRLRRELGLLPPGDLRSNMAALARDEALLTRLFQYRFGDNVALGEKSELQGHSFGNLLLAALTGITGSFDEALLAAQKVLALRGRVLPSTLAQVVLNADVETGDPPRVTHVSGESAIPQVAGKIRRVYLTPPDARAYPPAIRAIIEADLIVLGPGSLYTSIVPNLLVPDIAQALQHSRAPKAYVCNIAMQPGETDDFTVADHVEAITSYLPPRVLGHVLANDNVGLPADAGNGNTRFVQPVPPADVECRRLDLVDDRRPWRHDSEKLGRAIMGLLERA